MAKRIRFSDYRAFRSTAYEVHTVIERVLPREWNVDTPRIRRPRLPCRYPLVAIFSVRVGLFTVRTLFDGDAVLIHRQDPKALRINMRFLREVGFPVREVDTPNWGLWRTI